MVAQAQRRGPVEAGFLTGSTSHESNRQKLIQFRERAQQCDSRIKMRARSELDVFLRILDPVQDRHKGRNPEIAGDVKHPKPPAVLGKLSLQIAHIGIVELGEIYSRPLQSVVPP